MTKPRLNSVHPQHLILDIQPPQRKMTKLLQYQSHKGAHHSVKECSRAFHKLFLLNFEKNQYHKYPFLIQKTIIANLKQIKTLTYLDIEIGSLTFTHQGLKRLVGSFKHLKSLSVLHFHAILPLDISSAVPLCQALKGLLHDLPKVQVKLTLSVTWTFTAADNDLYKNYEKLLESFTKLRNFTSVQMNSSNSVDISKIQGLIAILNESKSLSHVSVTLSNCTIYPSEIKRIFVNMKSIKSLQNSRVHLKNCATLTKEGLEELIPVLKGFDPHRLQNLEIIFENCTNEITAAEWKLFMNSVCELKTPYKISARFIGPKKRDSTLREIICFLAIMSLAIGIPVTIVTLFGKSLGDDS